MSGKEVRLLIGKQAFQRWKDEELNVCQGERKRRKVPTVQCLFKNKGRMEMCLTLILLATENIREKQEARETGPDH